MLNSLKNWAWKQHLNIAALSFACRNKALPLYTRIWTFLVVSYALSPFHLIPTFVPILGKIDDYILIPFGISISLKIIPQDIIDESLEVAGLNPLRKGGWGWLFGIFFLIIWLFLAFLIIRFFYNLFN